MVDSRPAPAVLQITVALPDGSPSPYNEARSGFWALTAYRGLENPGRALRTRTGAASKPGRTPARPGGALSSSTPLTAVIGVRGTNFRVSMQSVDLTAPGHQRPQIPA